MKFVIASTLAGVAVLSAIALTPTVASAKHHGGHGRVAEGGAEEVDDEERGVAPKAAGAADEEDTSEEDGGAPVVVERTPVQKERRDQLVAKEHELVREVAHANGKRMSQRERQAIGVHWRHVMRLSRIRELAEQDHDTALLPRIDALLDKADKTFVARLKALAADGGAR